MIQIPDAEYDLDFWRDVDHEGIGGEGIGSQSLACARPREASHDSGYRSSAAAATATGSKPVVCASTRSNSRRFMRGSQNLWT